MKIMTFVTYRQDTLHHYIYIVIISNPTGGHFFVTDRIYSTIIYISSLAAVIDIINEATTSKKFDTKVTKVFKNISNCSS